MKKRILILHATAGTGHTRAAEAVAAALRPYPNVDIAVWDALDYTNGIFKRLYSKHYIRFVKAFPRAWGYIWETSDSQAPDSWFRQVQHLFNRANSRKLRRRVLEFAPDLVICTHYLPLEVLSYLKEKRLTQAPVFGVITDISAHSFRIMPNIDRYFAATRASARELEFKGYPASRVTVSGIPVDPIFRRIESKQIVRERHGLPPQLPTVLLMSGGFGLGPLPQITQSFAQANRPISLVVIAGRSRALKEKCDKIARRSRAPIKVFGYVDFVHELIDASDIVITKPGGLSSSEILVKSTPMVLVAPIPGQEQRNCEYLLENGAAARLYNYDDAAYFIEALLTDTGKLRAMSAAAQRIAFSGSATMIAATAMEALAAQAREPAALTAHAIEAEKPANISDAPARV